MTPAERLLVIKARLAKKGASGPLQPRGLYRAANPDKGPPPKKTGFKPSGRKRLYPAPFGIILPGRKACMMKWIFKPPQKPAKRPEPPRKGPHYLTAITEKWQTLKRTTCELPIR